MNTRKQDYLSSCRESFSFFMQEAFRVVNPGTEFANNWHIALLCSYLEAVSNGDLTRLIINIPPRSLKSTIVSICWPAWLLGKNPATRIICASYSQQLSDKLAVDSRYLLQSSFFGKIFPQVHMAGDQNKKNKFIVSERGFRFSTSVGGTMTGEGGDILILDDPHNALDVNSNKKRQKTIDWFQQSFLSRLDDKKNGAIVVVMQRLHPQDLTGFLLENNLQGWQVLKIPILSEKDENYNFKNFFYDYKKSELLYHKTDTPDDLENLKQSMGSYIFNAQYMQNPLSLGLGMIKKSWLHYYDSLPKYSDNIIQSWDSAIKSGDGNSYTVCTTWMQSECDFYLLDVYRAKIEYPELRRQVLDLYKKWKPSKVLVEDKASGQALLQDLRRDWEMIPFVPVQVKKDKLTRFASVTPLFETGRIMLPQKAVWLSEYEQEVLSFPNTPNDDQVDSTSQCLNYLMLNMIKSPRIRVFE